MRWENLNEWYTVSWVTSQMSYTVYSSGWLIRELETDQCVVFCYTPAFLQMPTIVSEVPFTYGSRSSFCMGLDAYFEDVGLGGL